MSVLFIEYPKCSTCKKAKKWLEDHGVEFIDRHIVEDNPKAEELKLWHEKSGLPLKRFFNTSGQIYRNNNIKDRLPNMSEEEQYDLLATDGMLVKRPLIVADDYVLVGFKEKEYEERFQYIGICKGGNRFLIYQTMPFVFIQFLPTRPSLGLLMFSDQQGETAKRFRLRLTG